MEAAEPRPRRRGFFLSSADLEELEATEQGDPEGLTSRLRLFRPRTRLDSAGVSRHTFSGSRRSGGRLPAAPVSLDDGAVQIRPAPVRPPARSATATGNRRRSRRRR